jgi:glycosyltransferase involved in cell wall biosynthesis
VIVTYPGYDANLFKPNPDPRPLKKYCIKKPYLLFLGSLRPSKNIEGLIKAFNKLSQPDLSLVIAGQKAWLYEAIFQLVKELKLEDKVIFTGFVEEAEIPGLMTEAEAFVMPSFFEGFGIPVVEAMACGTPVVVSKIASLPEVVGKAGIYIDPHDINSIVNGLKTALGPDRNKYIDLGFKQARKFAWEKTAIATIKVLESARI